MRFEERPVITGLEERGLALWALRLNIYFALSKAILKSRLWRDAPQVKRSLELYKPCQKTPGF